MTLNSATFRDIVEKGGALSAKLLYRKDAILPNWIRIPSALFWFAQPLFFLYKNWPFGKETVWIPM